MAESGLFYDKSNTAKDEIRPEFLNNTGKKQSGAAKAFGNSEKSAAGIDIAGKTDGMDTVKKIESSGGGNGFLNSVAGKKTDSTKGKKKGGFGLAAKKSGPMGLIIALILILGGLTLGAQTSQPFALVSNMLQNFDSASYSTNARLNTTIKGMLKGKKVKASKELKATLKRTGIDVEADDDGNVKALSFTSKDGTKKTIDGSNVEAAFKNDTEFTGKVAKTSELMEVDSFYSNKSKVYAAERIGWEKNRYSGFDSGGAKAKTEVEAEEDFKNIAANKDTLDSDVEGDMKFTGKEETEQPMGTVNGQKTALTEEGGKYYYTDGDGNKVEYKQKPTMEKNKQEFALKRYQKEESEISTGARSKKGSENYKYTRVTEDGQEVEYKGSVISDDGDFDTTKVKPGDVEATRQKINAIGTADADGNFKTSIDFGKIKKIASGVSAFSCINAAVSTAITGVVIAQQVSNMINLSSGYMEAVQKVQAGDGDGSSLHMYNNETNMLDADGQGFWTSNSVTGLFGSKASGTSSGLANLENIVKDVKISAAEWEVCTYSKLALNSIDLLMDIGAFFSFGITEIIKTAASMVLSGAIAVAVSAAIEHFAAVAIDMLKTDVVEKMGSVIAGDYTVGGAQTILGKMGQSVGLSAGTQEKKDSFARYAQTVIADRANYDRDNLSPFDTSSRYTFLGSLKYDLTKFAILSSGSQLMRTLSSASTVLTSAINNLLPKTAATTFADYATESGECPLLNSVGAVGSANLCIDFSLSDTSTFGISYEEAKNHLCSTNQLTNCGEGQTPEVVKNSELSKYIITWTMRDTHLGLADATIESHKFETGSTGIDAAIGAIPVVGALIDMDNAATNAANEEYIFGSAYVAGGEHWDKEKQYIQTFLELDTVYNQLGLIENSTLTAYLDDYYEENPLDKSYEARLARISGMTKEQVEETLAIIDYLEYVQEYNPAGCYAFKEKAIEEKSQPDHFINSLDSDNATIAQTVTFSDVRNRVQFA